MKKALIGIAVLGIVVLTFAAAGYVYAQAQTPPTPDAPFGPGMMGGNRGYGYGMMGGYGWMGDGSPMHEFMVNALADALGLSPEEIEARHDAGETLWEIASSEGLSEEEISDLLTTAHESALDEAVSEGWLTPEQAEWMQGHMDWMWSEGGAGGFGGHCGGGGWSGNNTGWRGMGY